MFVEGGSCSSNKLVLTCYCVVMHACEQHTQWLCVCLRTSALCVWFALLCLCLLQGVSACEEWPTGQAVGPEAVGLEVVELHCLSTTPCVSRG